MFCLIVTTYVVSAIGVPVFLHYCGGELEHVTYIVRGESCCGESDDNAMQDDCCKDENIIIKHNPNFTFNQSIHVNFQKWACNNFYFSFSFVKTTFQDNSFSTSLAFESPPPKIQNSLLISTSVFRI